MGLQDKIRTALLTFLRMDEYTNQPIRERLENYSLWQSYYRGEYRKQLRVKSEQADDNLGLNFVGLVVDRGISLLLGQGVDFDMGEDETTQEYIDDLYDANHSSILFHKACQFASIYGTGYFKLIPEGTFLMRDEKKVMFPRIVAIDPMWVSVETATEDMDEVSAYVIRYNVELDGQNVARKERTERALDEEGNPIGSWRVINYVSDRTTNGRWVITSEENWPYEFPPILHWQNLPQPSSVYGQSDIENIIELQDRINFVASNISKIIRYHAHPKTWGKNASNSAKLSWGADDMIVFQDENALLQNLEMQSDLASSRQFLMELRQSLFDISRTVDITSVSDKIGSLTNFGLRTLFMDSMAKIGTKQELFGEALEELNHRALTIAGIPHDDGGEPLWPETLPANETEEITALEKDLNLGLVSKQTASTKRGYDYDQEKERMNEDKLANENIGSLLINQFNRGEGNLGLPPITPTISTTPTTLTPPQTPTTINTEV